MRGLIIALFVALVIFYPVLLRAQQNGYLLLSAEILQKNAYPYTLDEFRLENRFPGHFSNQAWKYHAGDDIRWKEPGYPDKHWPLQRTDFNLDSLPAGAWTGIGWFRLTLVIDSTLRNQAIALVMNHYGASEVYLDGKLVNRFGKVSASRAEEQVYHPPFAQPIPVVLNDQSEHCLAVRYSFHEAAALHRRYGRLLSVNGNPGYVGFAVRFAPAQQAISHCGLSLTRNLMIAMVTLSVLILLAFFHLLLYWFYPLDRTNLYLTLLYSVVLSRDFTRFLPTYTSLSLEGMVWNSIIYSTIVGFWMPLNLVVVYSIYYTRLPRRTWLFFPLNFLSVPFWLLNSPWGDFVAFTTSAIFLLELIRVFAGGLNTSQESIWIVGVGSIITQVANLIFWSSSVSQSDKYWLLYPVYVAVPLMTSVFVAQRIGRNNRHLAHQLVQVKALSEKTLQQEQEKQQLLASQNETLEQQVQERTAELTHQKEELQSTLENLKATQSQLIHKEKMASLGELTAGIAHEIQNPLNFVNNFAEVSEELTMELKEELQETVTENSHSATVNELLNDLTQNLSKIHHHGQRADRIVKGMLQHSRTATAEKQLTDLNVLTEEYLRLAYHGLRAKEKDFNAKLTTQFDPRLGKVAVVAQDLGRVLLNLFNNAFYSMMEKKKQVDPSYQPEVSVSTQVRAGKVEICVRDNGLGIPTSVLDKIYQPFFTTKPTGKGTGLGLSLSYDIITKGHNGVLKVDTREGEYAEFIVVLPFA